MKLTDDPTTVVGSTGVTAIPRRVVGSSTVRVVLPLTAPSVAVMVVWPTPTAFAAEPGSTWATVASLDAQVTRSETSEEEPSLKFAVAL
jgi:hypothetical protein